MRESKYRGKRVDNGEWVYGSLLQSEIAGNGYCKCAIVCRFADSYNVAEHQVIPETVGQFMGVKDKNLNEVFEGDVLKEVFVPLGSNAKIVEYYKIGVAVWPNSFKHKIEGTNILNDELKSSHHKTERKIAKHPTHGEDWIDNTAWFYKMQVIGNIHDNPELLKDGTT